MISEERAETAGQRSRGQEKKTEKRDWLCSRFFLLAAFLCLFANQDGEAPGLFFVLFSAGIQAAVLWSASAWIETGRTEKKDEKRVRQRTGALLAAGFAGLFCVQLLLFTQAGGYPEDRELWIKGWGGLPVFGEWIWNHWKAAGIAAVGCVDLSLLAAVWFAEKQNCRKGCAGADIFRVFFLLFLLPGISPWLLVPQPLFFVMPVITGLMLYAAWEIRGADGEPDGSKTGSKKIKKGCLAGGAAVFLFLLCIALTSPEGAGIRAAFEGKSIPRLLLYWFESVKDSFSDGSFGWLSGPKLIPFTQNGQALRLQNTIYPGADRYGWYAGLVQGTWVLLLCMEAMVPVKKAGKETVFFLAAMLLLPLWQPAAGRMAAAAVFLPWLAVRASGTGDIVGKDRKSTN